MATKSTVIDLVAEMSKPEYLHPELREFVERVPFGPKGTFWLQHPLCVGPLANGLGHCAALNRMYQERKMALAEARSERDWLSFVSLHEGPYRLNAFAAVAAELSDTEYWQLLGGVIDDAEVLYRGRDVLAHLLRANRPQRQAMMDDASQKEFAALPDELIIYRGYDDEAGAEGWAWTLSLEKAQWFAKRWRFLPGRGEAMVVSGVVKKSDVIAYLNGRGERTVIVNPAAVKVAAKKTVGGTGVQGVAAKGGVK